ncbi:unnamed protein product [Phytophthora fragariaefolia]|uniref:Unnamed protein product n=1 Tax=Phytophthora fragariaefolia TaxID=1490495 RepID=A0A9W7CYS4_9STRA|nr:unnamed protein product [Phytophthora fragariaefolia]
MLLDSDSSDGREVAVLHEPATPDNSMTSEVEGDSSDSESLYVEHTYDADLSAAQEDADEDISDDGLDGEAIAERHRKNMYKRMATQSLREAVTNYGEIDMQLLITGAS